MSLPAARFRCRDIILPPSNPEATCPGPDCTLFSTAPSRLATPLTLQRLSTVFLASLDTVHPRLTVPLLSLVAVHGLNFKNSPEHARNTWTHSGQLWLKDFLPARLPKPARVMLFEYNASPAMGAAAIKLDDHAKNLLHWLDIRRKVSCIPVSDEKRFRLAIVT